MRKKEDIEKNLQALAGKCRTIKWIFKKWQPSAALFEKQDGGLIYKHRGGEFDSEMFELVKGGWGQDHCLFCGIVIGDGESGRYMFEGFTDGFDWICSGCHENVIVNKEDP